MGNICVFSEYLYLKPVLCEKEIYESDFTNFQTANFSLRKPSCIFLPPHRCIRLLFIETTTTHRYSESPMSPLFRDVICICV